MSRYVVIEAHDPFEVAASAEFFDLSMSLARTGHDVVVLFVGDGVNAALAGEHSFWLAQLARAGVAVLVDAAALAARDRTVRDLAPGAIAMLPGVGTDALLGGRKPLWIADADVRRAA